MKGTGRLCTNTRLECLATESILFVWEPTQSAARVESTEDDPQRILRAVDPPALMSHANMVWLCEATYLTY